jgi:hypothetical protein
MPTILFLASASGAQDFPVKNPQEKASPSSSLMDMATVASYGSSSDQLVPFEIHWPSRDVSVRGADRIESLAWLKEGEGKRVQD